MTTIVRLVVACIAAAVSVLVLAPMAAAHDPIFVADDQVTPDIGPYMPDGTISWALYGQVLDVDDTRGFEFDLRDGDELYVSLLIPNLEPELLLDDAALPVLDLIAPDGTTRTLVADQRTVFDEQFSRTSYITLLELREPAQAGRYQGVVIGNAPARFTVAVGEREIFFTETERSGERPSNFLEISGPLNAWYSTPPGGEPVEIDSDVGVDIDLVEEAMESGEGQIAGDGSLDGSDEAAEADEADAPAPEAAADAADADEPAAEDDATAQTGDDDSDPPDDEVAGIVVSADDGGGSTWVAPVVIGAIAVVGAGAFALRRRSADSRR